MLKPRDKIWTPDCRDCRHWRAEHSRLFPGWWCWRTGERLCVVAERENGACGRAGRYFEKEAEPIAAARWNAERRTGPEGAWLAALAILLAVGCALAVCSFAGN